MTDTVDLALIRAAAEAPATTPLVARLQAMLQQLLPLHEAAQAQQANGPSAAADAYEPTLEEINAFRDAVETARRYGYAQDDIRCVAEGLKAVRRFRP
jgi:hypothetical protein